ncbi:tetratricopeptide repeat protein [Posidoniimonas polymericola]|uniref:tetratricopeptide repeat protein n=1 Tax=Posidoniimonas polymericola TaxID=2528002 RepID=UPI0018D49134|nr:tetratricopeptide repeat protein [Posidoniimonas polymericola]
MSRGFSSVQDGLEGIESVATRVIRRPFRFLSGRSSSGSTSAIGSLGEATSRFLGAPFRYAARGKRLFRTVDSLEKVLDLVFLPVTSVAGFAYAWVTTRRVREVLLALPVLVLILPFAYVALSASLRGRGPIASRYQEALQVARKEGRLQDAELLRAKLAQLGVDNSRTEYLEALKIVDKGDYSTGFSLMQQLAPAEAPGFAEAHYWIAFNLVRNDQSTDEQFGPTSIEERSRLAEKHLDQLRAYGVESPVVKLLHAVVLARTGRLKEAAEMLEPISDSVFAAAAMRVRLLVSLERPVEAAKQAESVNRLYLQLDVPASTLTADEHRSRVLAATLLGDELLKEQALLAWRRVDPTNVEPAVLLLRHTESLITETFTKDEFSPDALVTRLCRAEELGSPRPWLALQLRDLIELRGHSESYRFAWLGLLGSPDASDEFIELAGTTAALRGQVDQARKAFSRLTDDGQADPLVWNNYAWALMQPPQPNLLEALQAIEGALKQEPESAIYRETRGQINVLLQRWPDAIEDLEFAVQEFPENKVVHKGLGLAYDATGKKELAATHWEQSGEPRPQNPIANP